MAKAVDFRLNYAGVGELLRGDAMGTIVNQYAQTVAGRAGDGFTYNTQVVGNRQTANVWPETEEAKRRAYEEQALLKALG